MKVARVNVAETLTLILGYYTSIVAIMNPFTALNNYVTLTEGMREEDAERILRRAFIVVIIIGMLFILAGRLILEFYQLSLASLRFGGGILLLYIAIEMLSGQARGKTIDVEDVAVVPLATPMIIGPGTMTLLINLATLGNLLEVIIAFLLSTLTVAGTLRASPAILRVLKRTGVRAMARFMSLIIASIAAQMIWSAVKEWITEVKAL